MSTTYDLNDLIEQARSQWLTPSEVHFILQNYQSLMITDPVVEKPISGSVIIYNKENTRYFRGDGYSWCKKPNKTAVNEGHVKLKVGGVAAIDCYYVKREDNHHFMRRIYWLLDQEKKHIALVHYRDTNEASTDFASISEASLENQVAEQPLVVDNGENYTADGINATAQGVEMLPHHSACQEIVLYEAENLSTPICFQRTPSPGNYTMVPHPSGIQAPHLKFTIKGLAPDWCYANDNTKVYIIGTCHCDPSELASAVFDGSEVPIQMMQDGVFWCNAPPKCTGKVALWIASHNGDVCSEVKEFEYRDKYIVLKPEQYRNDEEFGLIVDSVRKLLSDPSLQNRERYSIDLLFGRKTSGCTKELVLQVLLKDYLQQWFFVRPFYGDCGISKNERDMIIQVVGGLGYRWPLNHMLVFGVGVDAQDENGWTALHWAARFGRESMVAALISRGASVNAITSVNPSTPAKIAYEHGHKQLAKRLSYLRKMMSSAAIFKDRRYSRKLRLINAAKYLFCAVGVNLVFPYDKSERPSTWIDPFMQKYPAIFNNVGSMREVLANVRRLARNATKTLIQLQHERFSARARFPVLVAFVELCRALKACNFTLTLNGDSFSMKRKQRETGNCSKVDGPGFIPDEMQGLSGAGQDGHNRQKPDTFGRSKAKLVDLSLNEEQLASLGGGTSLMDSDDVDPCIRFLQTRPEY